MQDSDSHYDRMWELLKLLHTDRVAAGIPDEDAFPALADFLVMSLLAAGRANGVSEMAVEAIMDRMAKTLNDWRERRPPFLDFNGRTG